MNCDQSKEHLIIKNETSKGKRIENYSIYNDSSKRKEFSCHHNLCFIFKTTTEANTTSLILSAFDKSFLSAMLAMGHHVNFGAFYYGNYGKPTKPDRREILIEMRKSPLKVHSLLSPLKLSRVVSPFC